MKRFYKKTIVLSVFIQTLILFAGHNAVHAADPIIRIKISGAVYSDETIIRYNPSATTSFDFSFDASKIMSTGTTPSIYSIIGTKKYAINTLPNPGALPTIQLGSKILQTGSYTITFVNSTDMHGYYLYDSFLNSEVAVDSSSTYTFNGTVGDVQTRFELRYGSSENNRSFAVENALNTSVGLAAEDISVGSSLGGIYVTFLNEIPENYSVKVIGQGGRVLKSVLNQKPGSGYEFIDLNDLTLGSYIVIISADDVESSHHISLL